MSARRSNRQPGPGQDARGGGGGGGRRGAHRPMVAFASVLAVAFTVLMLGAQIVADLGATAGAVVEPTATNRRSP